MRLKARFTVSLMASLVLGAWASVALADSKIIHDAEYYILQTQNGGRWAAEDHELDKKLAALREKYGRPPTSFTSCGTIPRLAQLVFQRSRKTSVTKRPT